MNYIWPIYRAQPLSHEYIHNKIVFVQNGGGETYRYTHSLL